MEIGTVESFDPEVGLGLVADSEGRTHAFHCTAISDGSRLIEHGRAVAFIIGPAGPGRWEATTVVPLD